MASKSVLGSMLCCAGWATFRMPSSFSIDIDFSERAPSLQNTSLCLNTS